VTAHNVGWVMTDLEPVVSNRADVRPALIVAAVGATWVLLVHATGLLGDASGITFLLLGLGAVAAATVGIHRWKPEPRWPWWLVLVAMILFFFGGLTREAFHTLGDLTPSRSLLPDLLSLPGYVLLGAGFLVLARLGRRGRGGGVDATLDALVAALAALAVAWVYLINPALSVQHVGVNVGLSTRLLLIAYPAMSVFLVAIGAQVAFSSGGWRSYSFRMVMAAFVCLLLGDVIYMLVETHVATVPRQLIDVPYALSFVAFISALLHPSMRRLTDPVRLDETAPSRRRLALVALALTVPAIVTLTRTQPAIGERVVLAAIVLALTGTAVYRMVRALREHADSAARLAHQATHDALTGLPNRVYLHEYLVHLLGEPSVGHPSVALLFLDLDRFKLVNDTLGHGMGDELLIAVANRLRKNTRPEDVVGRIGGDEFLIVVDGVRDAKRAHEIAERTRLGFMTPFSVRGAEIPVSSSVGVAMYGVDEEVDAESMLRDADTAMYEAKDAGGDAVAVFDASMRDRVAQRLALESEMRHALERGEFHLHFQPIVRSMDSRVAGLEALLRWSHPTLGNISPELFVPIAEDTGLIVELGAWVLDQACAELATLRQTVRSADELTVSVNLSARQLRDDSLLESVARSLLRHQLPAGALCLELTESTLMENMSLITRMLATLRECGVRVSVDDFGTGYSSLAYLKQLPVDEVKIDRSFVTDLGENDPNASLVAAVVAIAGSLGVSTVAEGVETLEQAERLRELGCDEAQGFYFSRPVPPERLPGVLEDLGLVAEPRLRIVRNPA